MAISTTKEMALDELQGSATLASQNDPDASHEGAPVTFVDMTSMPPDFGHNVARMLLWLIVVAILIVLFQTNVHAPWAEVVLFFCVGHLSLGARRSVEILKREKYVDMGVYYTTLALAPAMVVWGVSRYVMQYCVLNCVKVTGSGYLLFGGFLVCQHRRVARGKAKDEIQHRGCLGCLLALFPMNECFDDSRWQRHAEEDRDKFDKSVTFMKVICVLGSLALLVIGVVIGVAHIHWTSQVVHICAIVAILTFCTTCCCIFGVAAFTGAGGACACGATPKLKEEPELQELVLERDFETTDEHKDQETGAGQSTELEPPCADQSDAQGGVLPKQALHEGGMGGALPKQALDEGDTSPQLAVPIDSSTSSGKGVLASNASTPRPSSKDMSQQVLLLFGEFSTVMLFGTALCLATTLPACWYFDRAVIIRQTFQGRCFSASLFQDETYAKDKGVYIELGQSQQWDSTCRMLCQKHGVALADDILSFLGTLATAEDLETWELLGILTHAVLGWWLMVTFYCWSQKRKLLMGSDCFSNTQGRWDESWQAVISMDQFMAEKFSTEHGVGGFPTLVFQANFYVFKSVMYVFEWEWHMALGSLITVPFVLTRSLVLTYSMFTFYTNVCEFGTETRKEYHEPTDNAVHLNPFAMAQARWRDGLTQLRTNPVLFCLASPTCATLLAVMLPLTTPIFRCMVQGRSFIPAHFRASFISSVCIQTIVLWALLMTVAGNIWRYFILEDLLEDLYNRTASPLGTAPQDFDGLLMKGPGEKRFCLASLFRFICGYRMAGPVAAEATQSAHGWDLKENTGLQLRRWIKQRKALIYSGKVTSLVTEQLVWALMFHLIMLAVGVFAQALSGTGAIKVDTEQLTATLNADLSSQSRLLSEAEGPLTDTRIEKAKQVLSSMSLGAGISSFQIFVLCDIVVFGTYLLMMVLRMANVNKIHDKFPSLVADAAEAAAIFRAGGEQADEMLRLQYVNKLRTTADAVKQSKKSIQVGILGYPITHAFLLANLLLLISMFASELGPAVVAGTKATCTALAESDLVLQMEMLVGNATLDLGRKAHHALNGMETAVREGRLSFTGQVEDLDARLTGAYQHLGKLDRYVEGAMNASKWNYPDSHGTPHKVHEGEKQSSVLGHDVDEALESFSKGLLHILRKEELRLEDARAEVGELHQATLATLRSEVASRLDDAKHELVSQMERGLASLVQSLDLVENQTVSLLRFIASDNMTQELAIRRIRSFVSSAEGRISRARSDLEQIVSKGVHDLRQVLDKHLRAVHVIVSRGQALNNMDIHFPTLRRLIQEEVCRPLLVAVRNATESIAEGDFTAIFQRLHPDAGGEGQGSVEGEELHEDADKDYGKSVITGRQRRLLRAHTKVDHSRKVEAARLPFPWENYEV